MLTAVRDEAMDAVDRGHHRRRRWRALAVLGLLYVLLVGPPIYSGRGGPSEAKDQDRYHLVVIETMMEQWPAVDLVHYDSATSPGYHLLMAAVGKAVGGGLARGKPAMRIVNGMLTFALLATVLFVAARFAGHWAALVLAAPAMCSPYVLGAAIFLTTDNAALLFVFLALGGAVTFGDGRPRRALLLGAWGALAVAVRQIHVWTAAPAAIAAALLSPLARVAPPSMRPASGGEGGWRAAALAAVAFAIPFAALAVFVSMWGGLMPPTYRDIHNAGPNPATFAFGLSLAAVSGAFLLPIAARRLRWAVLREPLLWVAALLGLLSAVAVPTSFEAPQRAYGWLWRVVELAPSAGERSLLLAVMAPAGAAAVFLLHRAAVEAGRGRPAGILLVSVLGWLCAQSANTMAWQRYFDPMVIVSLAWLAAMACDGAGRRGRWRWVWIGPALLAVMQLGLSAVTLYRELLAAGPA